MVLEIQNYGQQIPPQGMDPDAYAAQIANEQGITLDEAKEQLRTQFGEPEKPNCVFTAKKADAAVSADDKNDLSLKGKKEWLEAYMGEHGCSRAEAKEAFRNQFERNTMSHKEAKAWCKEYMAQNGCTKKEAKVAFKENFGYDVPLSLVAKATRAASLNNPVGVILLIADAISGGKVGAEKYLTGEGVEDKVYRQKTE